MDAGAARPLSNKDHRAKQAIDSKRSQREIKSALAVHKLFYTPLSYYTLDIIFNFDVLTQFVNFENLKLFEKLPNNHRISD